MTLSIQLPPATEAKLRERATASGEPLDAFVSKLVQSFATAPASLEEISGPIYQQFLQSGTTEDELIDELERAEHEMRADRRTHET